MRAALVFFFIVPPATGASAGRACVDAAAPPVRAASPPALADSLTSRITTADPALVAAPALRVAAVNAFGGGARDLAVSSACACGTCLSVCRCGNANTASACISCCGGGGGSGGTTSCPTGSYLSGGYCYYCSAGSYLSGTTCYACPAGQYASSSYSTWCSYCPAGTYAPSTGYSSCLTCPSGYTSSTGASSCSPISCPTGSYLSGGSCY